MYKVDSKQTVDIIEISQQKVLSNFLLYAHKIPAYIKFLSDQKINISDIKNIDDFNRLPYTNQENYIELFSLKDRSIDPTKITQILSSSGSSGKPHYWAQDENLDMSIAADFKSRIEKDIDNIDNIDTILGIVTAGMGVWGAGGLMSRVFRILSQELDSFQFITPGLDIDENMKILEHYVKKEKINTLVLIGYTSSTKDIIDIAKEKNLIKNINIYAYVGGDILSNEIRKRVESIIGKGRLKSLYAASEVGIMAIDNDYTPELKLIMEQRLNENEIEKIFNTKYIPSIYQYNPNKHFFQVSENGLIVITDFTSNTPLIRYTLNDNGGIITSNKLEEYIKEKIPNFKPKDKNPFIFISSKKDVVLSFYSVKIPSFHIQSSIQSEELLSLISGKFRAYQELDPNGNPIFKLHLELSPNLSYSQISKNDEKFIKETFVRNLRKINGEYNKLISSIKEKAVPQIILEEFGPDNSFKTKNKIKQV
jgi:phenylacetate-coenzyme A ligase PaaK-like adenylate-forming protein